MDNINNYDQLKEAVVTKLHKWAECEGMFPEKEANAFFYHFSNDKDKGHRRIAAQQLVIECISARYGNNKTFLQDLQKKLYEIIDLQDDTECISKVARNRQDAEKWINSYSYDTLQEVIETCNGKKHIKIYAVDTRGYRIKCVTICPSCWSMAEQEDIL